MGIGKINEVRHLKSSFTDERGENWDVIAGTEIRHVGYIFSKKGSIRANHYHKESTQWTFILEGRAEWWTKDMENPEGQAEKVVLGPGDLAVTSPGIAHALVALEDTKLLDCMDRSRLGDEYEKDTVRIKIA